MGLKVQENNIFGGVDSRSNPVNMPATRSLRTRNFVPVEAGHLRLRDGYSLGYTGSGSGAIHSIFSFRLADGTKFVSFFQGKVPYVINLSTSAITSPTVRGTAIASSSRWSMFFANNRLYAFNGTDRKYYDGTKWRDVGLPALSALQVSGITITDGVREITSTEATAVTLTPAGGGTFAAGKVTVYAAFFDTSQNELGPSTIQVSAAAATLTLNQKISVAVLPDLSAVNVNWVTLMAGIIGTGSTARFFTSASLSPTAYVRTSNVVAVSAAAHGRSTGDILVLSNQVDNTYSGVYVITVIDVDHFSYACAGADGTTSGGTAGVTIKVANGATTVDITAPTQDTAFNVNEARGLAQSSVGGAQPGYLFYASIYNPTTGQIGNRIKISTRYLPSSSRCNVHMAGLPDLSGTDSEWTILPGRTGDGGEVPYATIDTLTGAWIYAPSAATSVILDGAQIDGNTELPIDNYQPQAFDKVSWVGNRGYGCVANSASIYKTGSTDDAKTGAFVGEVTESWSLLTETFPTADAITSNQSYNYEGWFFSHSDLAILSELAAQPGWQGPWYGFGCAGQYAFATGWKSLPFWITGDKKLATMQADGPVTVSDEYEAALLARIGDAYLSSVELVYFRDASRRMDQLLINCRDSNGIPFQVIHDFNLRDERSPLGQGYDGNYQGALATAFTVCDVRDVNGILRIFAGGADGNIYQLFSGLTDHGTEFTADYISLPYAGPYREMVKQIEWYGDPGVKWFICRNLNVAFPADPGDAENWETLSDDSPRAVPSDEDSYHYHIDIDGPELVHAYLWMQLTSHSTDAPASGMGLNDPPHIPLEWYGRIYAVDPLLGSPRGK